MPKEKEMRRAEFTDEELVEIHRAADLLVARGQDPISAMRTAEISMRSKKHEEEENRGRHGDAAPERNDPRLR